MVSPPSVSCAAPPPAVSSSPRLIRLFASLRLFRSPHHLAMSCLKGEKEQGSRVVSIAPPRLQIPRLVYKRCAMIDTFFLMRCLQDADLCERLERREAELPPVPLLLHRVPAIGR